jgi:predicted permease
VVFDAPVAVAGLAAAVALGLAIGVPTAWFTLRRRPECALRAESRGSTSGRAAERLRHAFLVAQLALALTVLSAAGLLGLSLEKAMAVAPGFRPDHVLVGRVSLPGPGYPTGAAVLSFSERLTDTLRGKPGVTAAGIATNVPLSGQTIKSAMRVEGYERRPGESARGHYGYGVGGDYFAAMGLTLVAGRLPTAQDLRGDARVCVVDEDFARHYFGAGDAVGRRVFQGPDLQPEAKAFTIVGVVSRMKQAALTEQTGQGAVFFPFRTRMDNRFYVVTRTSVAPESFADTLRRAVRSLDPDLPVSDVRSMDGMIGDSLLSRRSPAVLASLFSCLAVLLTAVGIYGVVGYAVAERRREIALRVALGATPGQVRAGFLSLAGRLVATATGLGLAGAWAAGQGLRAVLFDVQPVEVPVFAAAAGVTAAVALVACLIPSARAARVAPAEVLNDE